MRYLMIAFMLMALSASAEDIEVDFRLDPEQISFSSWMGGDVIQIPGGIVPFDNGEPAIPGKPYTLILPRGTSIESVEVTAEEVVVLPGRFDVSPVTAAVLSQPLVPAEPSPVYLSREPFPLEPVSGLRSGNRSGYRIGSFVLVPFSYDPLTGSLSVITSARITVHCSQDPGVEVFSVTEEQMNSSRDAVENLVDNPEMIPSCSPSIRPATDGDPVWVAIGTEDMETVLQPLVDHRNTYTGDAEFVSVEWISANYSGYDTPEKIRNYLKDQFIYHSLVYALIVGDYGETTRISGLVYGSSELNNVTDHYYIDLDGTWDLDGDHVYGEENDGMDYYSDLYVGRFCSNVPGHVEYMVDKTISYETESPDGDWQTTALLAGAGLWPPDYWGSFVCEDIAAFIPSGWTKEKLYENSSGHPNNQIDIINDGCSYASIQGHGNWAGIYWYDFAPTEIVGVGNYTDMQNIDKLTIFHSMACMAGELTMPYSIAERLLLSPQGGTVGVMFNSSYGWGTPPSTGPSEWLEIRFAEQLFDQGEYRIGVAQCNAKDVIQPYASVPLIDWVTQENNLLGDPALTFVTGQTGIEGSTGQELPGPTLHAPYPNPISSGCSITYDLPSAARVSVAVYDVTGRAVRTLHSGDLAGGSGSLAFDGTDDGGDPLPSGCYTVVMSGSSGVSSVQLVVIR